LTPSITNGSPGNGATLVDALITAMAEVIPSRSGLSAAVSLGAALDHRNGAVYGSAPLWGASEGVVKFKDLLEGRRPDVRWHVVNDVTAGLLAYRNRHPELSGEKVLFVTVSSGIAARTFDPQTASIPLDAAGLQGEIGHLPSTRGFNTPESQRCACGAADHIAAYSSGPGIKRLAEAWRDRDIDSWRRSVLGAPDTSPVTFEQAFSNALDGGDRVAVEILRTAVVPFADVLTYALTLDPSLDRIVLSGGVIDAIGGHYVTAVKERMQAAGVFYTSEHEPEWAVGKLTIAERSDGAGLIGAGLFAAEASFTSATRAMGSVSR
jgi:predicted NBD/HSP70 family sugar kinase